MVYTQTPVAMIYLQEICGYRNLAEMSLLWERGKQKWWKIRAAASVALSKWLEIGCDCLLYS